MKYLSPTIGALSREGLIDALIQMRTMTEAEQGCWRFSPEHEQSLSNQIEMLTQAIHMIMIDGGMQKPKRPSSRRITK